MVSEPFLRGSPESIPSFAKPGPPRLRRAEPLSIESRVGDDIAATYVRVLARVSPSRFFFSSDSEDTFSLLVVGA